MVAPLQASPAFSTQPAESVTLIPLGAARLRISAFPIASPSGTRWQLPETGALLRLVNRHSGKVLGVDKMSHEDSAQVVQFTDNGTTDHLWQLLADDGGWYRIRNGNSGKVLGRGPDVSCR
ncbi:RICIN domain-containing protein [Streptomyces longwoodensis]|uniref:RICIN domain-containing protein n=1 Tax=Streptomyces longwoodensis TaxID=68231 RepID=UPI00384C8448